MSSEEQHEGIVEVLDEEFMSNAFNNDADTTCTICQAEFLDPDDLMIHEQQIHKVSEPTSTLCLFCTEKYTDLINFAEHFRDKHLTRLSYCNHCLRAFCDDDERRLHEKKHKRGYATDFCCAQCNEKFRNIRDLKKHDFEQHKNNEEGFMIQPFFPYLSGVLKTKAETVLHSLHTNTANTCVHCKYSTSNIKSFKEHSKTKKCKVFVCCKCSSVLKKKSALVAHMRNYCSKNYVSKKKQCPECYLEFNKSAFKAHKKNCRVIKCFTCDTQYNTMYELTEHQSLEHPSSIELKQCEFCWKQFVGTIALKKHIDRAHKPNLHLYKYLCIYCKAPFKHPQNLFGHFFTKHKDIEPFTCTICSKKFRLRKRFTLHIKLEHKSIGFVEFDENYHVFFTEKKSENPFIPRSLYENEQSDSIDDRPEDSILNSEMSVTETEGNQTEVESVPKPNLKRKRLPKVHQKNPTETITVESSDDEPLLVVKKRVQKQQKPIAKQSRFKRKQMVINKQRFTCNICNKYCYTYQNYNHHITLHSKKQHKKCIKCSKVFTSKEKLNNHIALEHSSSKLTDTLKYMLEKRKKGEKITDDLPASEKFRRTIKKVPVDNTINMSGANIKKVENGLSVQAFIENFTPEENKQDPSINNEVTFKVVTGFYKEPTIKMTKFEVKPPSSVLKLAMPVKFKPGQFEKASASIRLVKPVPEYEEDSQDNSNHYEDEMYRNDSIPEVAEEVMLEGTEETPKQTQIPHKIVIPKLPKEYKDLRIAHLLPEAPYYKIVKVNDVLKMQELENSETKQPERNLDTIKLADGTKLVNTNPLAHLLGKTPIEKVMEPIKNKYYKSKSKNLQGMLAEALSNLDKPVFKKKKEKVASSASEISQREA